MTYDLVNWNSVRDSSQNQYQVENFIKNAHKEGDVTPRTATQMLCAEISSLKRHMEEIERKSETTANGDQRNQTQGEIESAKQIVRDIAQYTMEKDEVLHNAAHKRRKNSLVE